MLVAVRIPPSNSWKNPVERLMSVLNLGFQSVGLMRSNLHDDIERKLRSCNSMNQVRNLAEKDLEIVQYVKDSIEPVKILLYDVIRRLKWKGNNLKAHRAATDDEISDLAKTIGKIEHIEPYKTTQKDLKSKCKLSNFIEKHCRVRHYMFYVKKCGLATCKFCKAPRLPADVFEQLCHLPDLEPSDGERYKI
jgi:hypothetical protein